MKIVHAKERVKVEECERCLLDKAYDFFEEVYQECETEELEGLAKEIRDCLEDFFETFIA